MWDDEVSLFTAYEIITHFIGLLLKRKQNNQVDAFYDHIQLSTIMSHRRTTRAVTIYYHSHS